MIDFLIKCNIPLHTLNKLYQKNSSELFALECNEEQCIKIIDYLKNIGVTNIDELLLNRMQLFYKTKNEIESMFLKYNINDLVQKINDDYMEIDALFE